MPPLMMLSEAIKNKCPISFSYLKDGKTKAERIGNPHAVYSYTSKEGITSIKVHIYQTGGASDTKENIPDWRNFDLEKIQDVRLIQGPPFSISKGYNPSYYLKHSALIKI